MKKMKITKLLKLILIPVLLGCLLDLPYGYYQFVRFVSAAAFVFFAMEYYKEQKKELTYLFISLAVLFQPLIKIALGRGMWNIVDVLVAIGLLVLLIIENKEENN